MPVTFKYLLLLFIFISFSVFATSSYNHLPFPPPLQKTEVVKNKNKIRRRILEQYNVWRGVKYQWGGTGKKGIDCSALMQKIFRKGLSKYLPRTTAEQIKEGHNITFEELMPGDLVFFKTKPRVRHVGVYLGNDEFLHASSSKGVMISNLENNYWEERFETARRIL